MDILVKLLIAHVVTDFFIQPDSWVEDKRVNKEKSKYLYIHVVLTALVAWLFLFDLKYWWAAIVILISHYIIDLLKLKSGRNDVLSFLLDQIAHFLIIVGVHSLSIEVKYQFQNLSIIMLLTIIYYFYLLI